MTSLGPWWGTAIALVLLVGVATTLLSTTRVPSPFAGVTAIARAVVQLAALSLVLTGVITSPLWVGVGLVVMLVAAVWTAARRAGARGPALLPLATAMCAGPLLVMTIVFTAGAVELSPRYVLAVGGIVIGNTMTVAVLTSRLRDDGIRDHWDEVEAWLALGADEGEATRDIGRRAIRTALLPSFDQTRTTGIVVLPGAFVGAIFGGASPLEAGRFQIVVLACILAAGALTATVLVRWRTERLRRPTSA